MRPQESFVGQSIRSLQTMLRVLAEDDPTLPNLIPDGIYGNDTASAVSAFQRRNGLPVTGITDQTTWEAVVTAYEPALIRVDKAAVIEVILNPNQVIRKNEQSPYLYLVQSMLTVLALEHLDAAAPNHTGILDDATEEALAAFQLLTGLPQTGTLDKITWKTLTHHFALAANRQQSALKPR